jgi:SAM-dependent methyltransferase
MNELTPSPWIVRFAPLVARGARVLDLAAGHGRHALFFAARHARVLAADRDGAALAGFAATPGIETRTVDLESGDWPFPGERFDAIVAVRYLHRALFPHLLSALADDGVVLYETFALGNARYGRPADPAFLLTPGELLDFARDRLTVVAFEQGLVAAPQAAVQQRLAAVGRARAWPPPLPQ